jgi:hypothetical protein
MANWGDHHGFVQEGKNDGMTPQSVAKLWDG